jgi:hypothetical protein
MATPLAIVKTVSVQHTLLISAGTCGWTWLSPRPRAKNVRNTTRNM